MDFKEQVRDSVDIVKVVGDYVRLRRVGATGRHVGLCPFHQEKTPSFGVNQTQQFYKCFGCGEGGDVFKFVCQVEGVSFFEALQMLAERNGIPMPKRSDMSDPESRLRGALHEIHNIATSLYQDLLQRPEGQDARAYLQRRGIAPELVETFAIGFSDPHRQALTRKLVEERFTAEQMEASGLVQRRNEGSGHYDTFGGRLMFPIHNESGKVIAFGGRAMKDDEQPKYRNSPETPIYKKSSTLYNLHRSREGMRKAGRAVLVEGYMDVIGAYSAGVREVVASCGTALTNAQIRNMRRHADTVVVNFDPDNAGANAAEKAIQLLLDENLHVKVVALEGGLDPDEYVKQNGVEAYRAKLDQANGYFHWLADRARGKFDMRSTDGRMDAFKYLMPAVQKLPDKLERAAVASDLAGYLGVEPSLVLEQFKKAATDRSGQRVAVKPPPRLTVPALERILVGALISNDAVRQEILPQLPEMVTASMVTGEIIAILRQDVLEGAPVTFGSLDARLQEPGRALLHEVGAADEIGDEAECLARAQACLKRLEEDFRKNQIDQLRGRVKAAERDGNVEEALNWMREIEVLKKGP